MTRFSAVLVSLLLCSGLLCCGCLLAGGPCVLVGLSFYDLNKVIIQFLFGKRLGMRFNTILIFRFPSETTTINMS